MSRLRSLPSVLVSVFHVLLSVAIFLPASIMHAQRAEFAGATTPVNTGGLTLGYPRGVATDNIGNLYIVDTNNNQIVKVAPSGDTSVLNIGGMTLYSPGAVAVDGAGNFYISDTGNNRVVKVTAGGAASVVNTSGWTLANPQGVAVDGAGNLYIADQNHSQVLKVAAGGGSTTQVSVGNHFLGFPMGLAVDKAGTLYIVDYYGSVLEVTTAGDVSELNTGSKTLSLPMGIALDSMGNVYIAEFNDREHVLKITPGFDPVFVNTGNETLNQPFGVALDSEDNLYIADTSHNRVVEVQSHSVKFGAVNVCASGQTTPSPCTQTVSVTFNLLENVTLGAPQALTQGKANLDFAVSDGGTCASGSSFHKGDSCTLNLTFAPGVPGERFGAVQLMDSYGNVLVSTYAHGNGIGPAVGYLWGTQSVLNSGSMTFGEPDGIAVDGSGNVYVSDNPPRLVKVAPDGSTSLMNTGPLAHELAFDMSVDGAGNLYVLYTQANKILKITPDNTPSLVSTGSLTLNAPRGIDVDGDGTLYISDTGNRRILKITADGNVSVVSVPDGILLQPFGLAVDRIGNIYVAIAAGQGSVVKITPSGATSELSLGNTIGYPADIAVDSVGNVYISDISTEQIVEKLVNGDTYILAQGLNQPYHLAIDRQNNVFIGDTNNRRVLKLDRSNLPSHTFQSTNVGSQSDVQETIVQNMGNAQLNFDTPATGSNPSYPANFPARPRSSDACTAGASVAPGALCYLTMLFQPLIAGSHSGNVVITDNAVPSTQSFNVSGAANANVTLHPDALSSAVVGTNYSQALIAAGGFAPYTFQVTSGTLPTGLSLGSNGVFSGTPTATGTANFSVTATDANNNLGTRGYLLTVVAASTINLTVSPSSVSAGAPMTLTATVTSGGSPVVSGQVIFCDATAISCDGAAKLATAQLTADGTASAKVILGIGTHSIKAVFAGINSIGTSNSVTQATTVAGTYSSTTAIASSGDPGNYTLTATVTGNNTLAPKGTVSFLDTSNGNASLGTATLGTDTTTTLSFVPSATRTLGTELESIEAGDFNGDGRLDLAIPDGGSSSVRILLGNGDGTFTEAAGSPITVGQGPFSVILGDFNGDGRLDLASANGLADSLSILLGNGDGTFTTAPGSPISVDKGLYRVTTGDFNGDGRLDLATSNNGDNSVSILLGGGDGTFTVTGSPIAVDPGPYSIAVGDLNGDGRLDLATSNNKGNSVSILLGGGNGTFTAAGSPIIVGERPTSVTEVDFNGDGKLDLAIANSGSSSVTILLGNRDGTFTEAAGSPITVGKGPVSASAVDLNGDGKLDLAIANQIDETVSILLGNGDGTFTTASTTPAAGASPTYITAGDFNGDGRSDLATANEIGYASFLLNTATTTVTATLANVSVAGTGEHKVNAGYGGDTNYSGSTSDTVSLTGSPLTAQTITFPALSSPVTFGVAPIALTATASSGLPVTYSVTGPATISDNTLTITGVGTVVVTASQAGNAAYQAATPVSQTVVVNASNPTGVAQTITFPALLSPVTNGVAPIALTATASSGLPVTYSVTGPATISGNTLTISGVGTVVVTASQAGNTTYQAATPVSQTVIVNAGNPAGDFTFAGTGSNSQTVIPGGAVKFTYALTPANGVYPGPVSFTATGLPPGATYSVSPATIAANAGPQTVTLTVQTAPSIAQNHVEPASAAKLLWALLLLPLAGAHKLRRSGKQMGRLLATVLFFIAGVVSTAALTGCGTRNGFLGQTPKDYIVTVTATAGSVQHVSTVTLNVQ